jgi:anaerobic magnesium-protoporphyrin IX monomethyl ester cyclase
VCVGEGEEVLVEFADCLQNNTDWTAIAGTWARAPEGAVVKNPKRPSGSLDNIAIPDWDPSQMIYINSKKVKKNKIAFEIVSGGDYQIMTQRGCPFSCSFCVESRYQEMFGKKNSLRRRSADLVIEELVNAKELFNPKVLWFWDDVFTVNPRWLKEFLPKYKEKVGIPFWCYTYPTTHNLELLKDLKAAGCNCISMGIQSGSERILKDVYNRPTPLDRVIEASQEIVDAGLHGYFDLISKSSFETEADLRSTFEFLIDLPMEMNYGGIGEMKSYPTYSYTAKEEAAKEGNIITALSTVDARTYDYYHNLYWVARNPFIDRQEKLEIGNEPIFRKQPELLEQFFYGVRSVHQAILQMRHVTEKGEHPNTLFPPAPYVHRPFRSVVECAV